MTTDKCGRCGKHWNVVEDYVKHRMSTDEMLEKCGKQELLKKPRANIFEHIKILIP